MIYYTSFPPLSEGVTYYFPFVVSDVHADQSKTTNHHSIRHQSLRAQSKSRYAQTLSSNARCRRYTSARSLGMSQMRAILVRDGAGPIEHLFLGETARPKPSAKDVLIKVRNSRRFHMPPRSSAVLPLERRCPQLSTNQCLLGEVDTIAPLGGALSLLVNLEICYVLVLTSAYCIRHTRRT